jgi:uncharacterized protein (DUF1697 family)
VPKNVAMLRGINVGARNQIKMAELEALFSGLGHTGVVTYIQSGNVVFKSRSKNTSTMARAVEARIARDLGLDVQVLLRTHDDLARVVRANPFVRSGADPAKLHVTFLADPSDAALVAALGAEAGGKFGRDEFRVISRHVYVHCPDGYGNTKINNAFFEKRLKTAATTRNWNTVKKLLDLSAT